MVGGKARRGKARLVDDVCWCRWGQILSWGHQHLTTPGTGEVGRGRSHERVLIGSFARQVFISYLPHLRTVGRNLTETFSPRLPITDGKVIATRKCHDAPLLPFPFEEDSKLLGAASSPLLCRIAVLCSLCRANISFSSRLSRFLFVGQDQLALQTLSGKKGTDIGSPSCDQSASIKLHDASL